MPNVLCHVPAKAMSEVAEDLKAIFKVRREKTARALAEEFIELHGKSFPKAASVFELGMENALTSTCVTQAPTTPGYARRTCRSDRSRR